jgi:hypothetical protein
VGEIAVSITLLGSVAAYWMVAIRDSARHERAVLQQHARAISAHYAAVEASEDDPSFSPEAIEQSVAEIVALADGIWRTGTSVDSAGRPDAGLVKAWARSWQSCHGNGLEVVGEPTIDLLSVVNRESEDEDRVVVRVRLRILCKPPNRRALGRYHVHADERWTFGRSHGRLVLVAVGGDPLAGPVLSAPLIPNPIADTERLVEESLAESANGQNVGNDVVLTDLVAEDEPPAFALLDLSLVDTRFLPVLIAAELAHLIEVWEDAVTGSEVPLEEMASADARAALLRPGPGLRLIVRDPVLKSWEPTRLHLAQHPPAIEIALDVEAVRYVVRDDGSVAGGNQTGPHRMALQWNLELTDSTHEPWRLALSNCPAQAVPGWAG